VSKKQKTAVVGDGMIELELDQLVPKYATREANPNKMSDEEFAILTKLIKEEGFLSAILVRPWPSATADGRPMFEILDGHHRSLAAAEVGLKKVLAVTKTSSDAKSLAFSIGMNKIRGELDFSQVGEHLRQLADGAGWEAEQISLYTGFSTEDIEALIGESTDPEDIMDDVASAPSTDEAAPEKVEKPFVLEITFATRDEYRLARKKLKQAAGKGGDLSTGLMNVLGEKED